MAVEIIDLPQLAHEQKRRKVVFNTPRLHACMGALLSKSRRAG